MLILGNSITGYELMSIHFGRMDRGIKFSAVGYLLSESGFTGFKDWQEGRCFFNRIQPQQGICKDDATKYRTKSLN